MKGGAIRWRPFSRVGRQEAEAPEIDADPGLEQVIDGVRALDMDAIRTQLAQQNQPA